MHHPGCGENDLFPSDETRSESVMREECSRMMEPCKPEKTGKRKIKSATRSRHDERNPLGDEIGTCERLRHWLNSIDL